MPLMPGRIIKKKRSLIGELFITLFFILLVLIIFLGVSTYKYAEDVIVKEVIELNSNMLQQVAIRINQELDDVENLASRIAYDTQIIDYMKDSEKGRRVTTEEELRIEGIMADYIWSYKSTAMLMDAHLIDRNDHIFSSSYSMSSGQKEDFDLYPALLWDNGVQGSTGSNLAYPVKLYRSARKNEYYYQVVRVVQDYISRNSYGMMLLNVNEKLLWNNYIRLISEDKDFFVVDQEGVILSHDDKNRINETLEGFAAKDRSDGFENYYIEDGRLFLFHSINDYGWVIVEAITLESAMAPLHRIQIFLMLLGSLLIVLMGAALRATAKKISAPLRLLNNKMKEFNEGDMSVQIPDSPYEEFSEVSVSFSELIEQVHYLLEENISNERQKRLLELNFLQAQINPHFIYNTLSSIRFYVEMGKTHEAEDMLYHFSRILRRVLTRTEDFVFLKDEIKLIEDYIALQKRRYQNTLQFINLIDSEVLDIQIPSFILQPIVENAIFYGFEADRPLKIWLEARVLKNDLYLSVSDNGPGISREKVEEIFNQDLQISGVGIINVHERIKLLYGPTYGLTIEDNNPQGSRIILKLKRYA